MRLNLFIVTLSLVFFLFGCSGDGSSSADDSSTDITGYWKVYDTTSGSADLTQQWSLLQSDTKIEVSAACVEDQLSGNGTLSGSTITLTIEDGANPTKQIEGTISGQQITGTYTSDGVTGTWTAEKTDSPECMSTLNLVTSFGDTSVDLGAMKSSIDVDSAGKVYINNYTAFSNPLSPIHVFDNAYSYQGTLKDSSAEAIGGDTIHIDNNDTLHVYYVKSGLVHHNSYSTDGTAVSSFENADNTYTTNIIDRDDNGNNFLIPCCGSGTDASGRALFLWKLSDDFATLHGSLDKDAILAMLPGPPEETDISFHDLKVLASGEIVICVDMEDDQDGLLILNSDLTKKTYLGEEWTFNGSWAVDEDSDGYLYVSSAYHNKLVVLNADYEIVANAGAAQIDSIESDDDFLPTNLRVKDEKVYVLNARDDSIYVFNRYSSAE